MAIRLSGLISGMDTDAMITELVSAYSMKKDKYVKAQTKLEWKQDAWKDLNTKIYGFYSKSLSSMRFSNAFNKKVAKASSDKANVTASADAVIGTQSLKINQLAKSGYLTGAVLKNINDGSKIKGDTKLEELGITDESSFDITVEGKTTSININKDTTMNQLVVKLKDAGVSVNFDEGNQRMFVSAKKSGLEGDFKLTANSSQGIEALKSLGLYSTTDTEMAAYNAIANGDVDAITQAAYDKQKKAYTTVEEQKELLEKQLEADKDNVKEYASQTEKLYNKLMYAQMSADDRNASYEELKTRQEELKAKDASSLTEEEKAELEYVNSKIETIKEVDTAIGSATLTEEDIQKYIDTVAEEADKASDGLAELNNRITKNQSILDGTADADVYGYSDIEGYVASLNSQIDDDNEKLKEKLKNFYTEQRDTAQDMVDMYDVVQNYSSIQNPTAEQTAAYNDALAALGMDANGAVRIVGVDASITLNGADYTSNTNSFSINGLTVQATAVTEPGEEITITTDQDTQGIYDMVKNFFKEYNTLINEMDSLFNASSSKGYEPLTDEEKEGMSESEIEKWEKKIKDSLLRRDDTLDSVATAMKSAMNATFKINGKDYSLSSFGIRTLGYFASADNEKSAYHIDGDNDDAATSGNADKLMKAIASDAGTVAEFFNKLSENLYTQLSNKMKSSSVSSAYTVYNDKKMQREYDEYDDIIEKWEEKIERYEEKYVKQFSAMESALARLNSQQSQLGSMLGM